MIYSTSTLDKFIIFEFIKKNIGCDKKYRINN